MIRRLLDLTVRFAVAVASLRFALEALRSPRTLAASTAATLQPRGFVKRWLWRAVVLGGIAAAIGALVVVSGVVPIKASSGHWSITEAFLQFAKRRSVAAYSIGISVPALDEERLVVKGAAHYDTACRPCHGSPALEQPRIARQMLPRPPDLRDAVRKYDPEDLFFIVKHGIKLTGMPAWPALNRDDEVWAMVAFLRQLPGLAPPAYTALARGRPRDDDAGAPLEDLLGATSVPPAIAESCGRCHGTDGAGRGAGAFPRLAGQRPAYLLASLQAYARGERHSGIMEPVAASLGPDEMQRLAEYYSSLPRRGQPNAAPARNADVERGRIIAHDGVPANLVPACVTCHGPGPHRRNPVYPALAGQYADYLRLQLSLFSAGHRGGTPFRNIMQRVAGQLTEGQRQDVAAYYASLSPGL
jgi:cytochrome c553